MASPSSEKIAERQPQPQAPPQQIKKSKDLHVSLPTELIEKLKNIQNWGERFRWTYDEDKVRRVWEIQRNVDFDDLIRHVMYGDGLEVVWEHDIWNLQHITQVPPPPQPQPQVAKCTDKKDDDGDGGGDEDDEEPPSPMADKSNKDSD